MKLKRLLKAAVQFATDRDYRFLILSGMGWYDHWTDERYVQRKYRAVMKNPLDLKNPQTLNEKLQWIKLYDRKPEYTVLVDKVKAREVIAQELGEEYLIPSLGVWERPEDIDFDVLPDQFVLKCNHNSGLGMCICKDKSKLDIPKVRRQLKKGLEQDYYLTGREWAYKDVPRRILGERYMSDGSGQALVDYKFYCFHGKAEAMFLSIERETGTPKFYFFDRDWNLLRYNRWGQQAPEGFTLPKPEGIEEMFRIAEQLSRDIPFVRIDLYNINGKIYFGEYTLYPSSGFDTGRLPETDRRFGEYLNLRLIKE